MPCIQDATRFDEHHLDLFFRKGFVLDTLWDHKHLARANAYCAIPKIYTELAIQNNESLISVLMIVPYEIPFDFDDLELLVVHFGNDLWLPMTVEFVKLCIEIYGFIIHVVSLSLQTHLLSLIYR